MHSPIGIRSAHAGRIGIYYEPGKEPPADGPPKLHLLIESNEEWRVRFASSNAQCSLTNARRLLTGGAGGARDQAAAGGGVGGGTPGGDAEPHRDGWPLQRRVRRGWRGRGVRAFVGPDICVMGFGASEGCRRSWLAVYMCIECEGSNAERLRWCGAKGEGDCYKDMGLPRVTDRSRVR